MGNTDILKNKQKIIGCTKEFNSKYKLNKNTNLRNYNYNSKATIHNNIEIPFLDLNNDGKINEDEVHIIMNEIIKEGNKLTLGQVGRIKNDSVFNRVDSRITILDLAYLLTIMNFNKI